MKVCVISSSPEKASHSYAEALATTQGFDFYSIREAMHLSLSRYDFFLTSDDPSSFGVIYLTHQFPDRVFSLVASVDREYMVRVLVAAREKKIAGIITASIDDYNSLKLTTDCVIHAPVEFSGNSGKVALYGFPTDNSKWLNAIQKLLSYNKEFMLIPPVAQSVLDMFEKFPLSYQICAMDSVDKALLCADILVYGNEYRNDRVVSRALSYGKTAVPLLQEGFDSIDAYIKNYNSTESINKVASDNLYAKFNEIKVRTDNKVFLNIGGELKKLKNLLVKFPTRGRVDKFLDVLENAYCKKVSGDNKVTFLLTLDNDDDTVNKAMLARVSSIKKKYKFKNIDIVTDIGHSDHKIDAMNRGIKEYPREWDVLLIAQDDMIPQIHGWDSILLMSMEKYFPDTDGSLWFNDGYVEKRINTLVILGKKYYDRFGYVYHPSYEGMWCDNELTDVGGILGRQVYINWCVIKHEHPMNNQSVKMDGLYDRYAKCYQTDRKTYIDRVSKDFDGGKPEVLLSILIPTMPNRRDVRNSLCAKLRKQIKELRYEGSIEILIDEDSGEATIGEKRTSLVRRSHGEYIMFMDDDDDIADTYIENIAGCLASRDTDAVTFGGIVTQNPVLVFIHSIMYNDMYGKGELLFRPPNHLNALRRSIAVQTPFISASFGEDSDYAMRISKNSLIKSEKFIPLPLYIYRPSTNGACSKEMEKRRVIEVENKVVVDRVHNYKKEGIRAKTVAKDRLHRRSRKTV